MIYPEYERYSAKFNEVQERFMQVLLEKERLFTKTLPNAIRYDRDQVQCSVDGNPLEDYVISLDEENIDEKLNQLRESMKDWEILLRLKEKELRSSPVISDKVYLYRYVDGYRIGKI